MMGKCIHSFRGYELPNIVMREGHHLSGDIKHNMILWQCIADKLIETIIDEAISHVKSSHSESQVRSRLTLIEENAMHYAGGFVIRKVLKNKGCGAGTGTGCLTRLLLNADTSTACSDDAECRSFYDYTKMWINKTDRGGLHHISDLCHELFYEIEQCVCEKLQNNLASKKKIAIEQIEHDTFVNADVQ